MATLSINRAEKAALPFVITDANNGLAGMRVTWVFAAVLLGTPLFKKVGGLPGSSADITVTSQTGAAINGTINLAVADSANLAPGTYFATLWVDDGAGNDRCVSPGGFDQIVVVGDVART